MSRFLWKKRKGFSLIEILVAVGVFVIFAIGIYSGIEFVFKVVYNSRVRIIETAILNEQVEVIRNIGFHDVGIINGSPSGVLERTVTTTRNGIDFEITRTIRNIDDPYDGTIGGNPNDTAPADYKLVDVEIICTSCRQQTPISVTTYVAPKYLEGDPTHGALFIEVFDANALPVQGADVHVVAVDTDPTVDLTDTTDNDGMLRLVDLGSGVNSYEITVSKAGYTTDMTISPSPENPNPVKPFATVVAQDVTEISFSIDKISSMSLSTIDVSCQPIGSVGVDVAGTRLWGTNPDVLKVDESITTDGSGNHTMNNLQWDNYSFSTPAYDIIGAIPVQPISLLPDTTQPAQLVLGPKSTHALNLAVLDDATSQPIANASVQVTFSSSFDETEITGVGSVRQTDWSGGGGQTDMVDNTKFFVDDGNLDTTGSLGDITLEKVGQYYTNSGWLESSTFDLGTEATYHNIIWEPISQPVETGDYPVKFQVATASTTPQTSWDYLGPDGTASTYFTTSNFVLNDIHDGDRYMRYKIYLSTADNNFTPTLSDVSLTYTNSCTPPGQVYFPNLSNVTYNYDITVAGYEDVSGTVDVSGYTLEEVRLSSE